HPLSWKFKMKKLIAIFLIGTLFTNCKNDPKKETVEESDLPTTTEMTNAISEMRGNFVYYEDAAVFQTNTELYGVLMNEKLEDLILQSETLKNEPTDEVTVTLKAKKSKKQANEEGWENRIEILEIVKVSKADPQDNEIIKLGTKNNS
ncbi:MAG: hypothetical protein ABIO60_03070, partial [Aquaticitalea sp.]